MCNKNSGTRVLTILVPFKKFIEDNGRVHKSSERNHLKRGRKILKKLKQTPIKNNSGGQQRSRATKQCIRAAETITGKQW